MYEAYISTGGKEYGLGKFHLAVDAALAYDMAYRFSMFGFLDEEGLEAYEVDLDMPDWFEYGNEDDANNYVDTDKLNFKRPQDFLDARDSYLKAQTKRSFERLRNVVRGEAIAFVKEKLAAEKNETS